MIPGKFKLLLGFAAMGCAFYGGWQVNGWRLESRYQQEEIERQEAVRIALLNNAAEVQRINQASQQRESALLAEQEQDQQFIAELQNEIETRPIIREEVRVPIRLDSGELECPSVPRVAWGVFQDVYNRAATGAATSDTTGDGDAGVSRFLTDNRGEPRSVMGAGSSSRASHDTGQRSATRPDVSQLRSMASGANRMDAEP